MPIITGPRELFRRFTSAPGFTLVAIATIAIGIGANAAIFGVVNGILLKPLPYPHPDRLISLAFRVPQMKTFPELPLSPSTYLTFRDYNRSLDGIGLWNDDSESITGITRPEQVAAIVVTSDTLPLLGVRPIRGRLFTQADDTPGAPATTILSYGFWQQKFGGDPDVIGRKIRVDGGPHEVIGILPPKFRFMDRSPAVYNLFQFDRKKLHLGNFSYGSIALLKPGVSRQQAGADIARMLPIWLRSWPVPEGYSRQIFEGIRMEPWVRPLAYDVVGNIGDTLWIIMGTVGLVLLIASANVANLLLVRTEGRHKELAVRAAIGASRSQLAWDIFGESIGLALAGGALGLLLAYGALRLLVAIAPTNLPRLSDVSIDSNTVLFTAGISILAGFLFGAIPALKYARATLGPGLRGDRSGTTSRERHIARSALVVLQVTLAVILLVSSGLMIRTALACAHVYPGFSGAPQLQTLQISIAEGEISNSERAVRTEQSILETMKSVEGVKSAAIAASVPMDDNHSFDPVFARDKTYSENAIPVQRYEYVSPGFFDTMGAPLVAGRDYTWADAYEHHHVAIVSERLAKEYWGSAANALGKQIRGSKAEPWREVVGVAPDIHFDAVNKPAVPQVYWQLLMDKFEGEPVRAERMTKFVVRSDRAGSEAFAEQLRKAVWAVDPALPIAEVRTMQAYLSRSLARTSFTVVLLSVAAGMALLLGLIGIYAVIAYSVTQRRREIGVRVAIGARPGQVLALFLRSGFLLTGLGIVIGTVVSSALLQVMSSLLFGVSAVDVPTYIGASFALLLAAMLASYVPSRRALKVDPAEALRTE